MSEWLLKRISSAAGWLAIAVFFGLIVFAANIEIKDLDLWLHLATGRYILENFSIPKVDVLSCTIAGQPWINHEWLFQVLLQFIYQVLGFDGLMTLQVMVVGVTFALLLLIGYNPKKQLAPLLTLLLVLLVYQLRMTLRPDIFSLLFVVLYIQVLALQLNRRSSIWLLFIIQVLWTNIHGFFIMGPVLVLIGVASEWIKRHVPLPFEWNKIGRLNDEEYHRLGFIFASVCLASFLNPHLAEGVMYPLKVLFSLSGESKIFFSYISELQKPLSLTTLFSLREYPYYKILIYLSTLSFILNYRKVDIGSLIFWLIFLLFSLNAVRNIVFFALAAYIAFLSNFECLSWQQFFGKGARLNKKVLHAISIAIKAWIIVVMINYIGGLSRHGYFDFDTFQRKSEYGGVSLRNFPYKAANFLVENEIKGNFLNDFNSGAYLLGRASPNVKVFIDGRTEYYGSEFFQKYRKIWKGDRVLFDEAVEKYQLTAAFLNSVYLPAPPRLIRHLYNDKNWVLVYFDYDASIFLKDIPQNKRWIDQFAMDLSQWETEKVDLLKFGTNHITPYQHINRANAFFHLRLFRKASAEVSEALRIAPNYSDAYKLQGKIDIKEGEYEEALENLRKAKILNARDIEIRYHLGVAFFHLDQLQEAYQQCQKVLADNAKNPNGLFLLSAIYAKEGKYEDSFKLVFKAHKIAPNLTHKVIESGDLYVSLKQFDLARKIYALVLKSDKENQEAINKINSLNAR